VTLSIFYRWRHLSFLLTIRFNADLSHKEYFIFWICANVILWIYNIKNNFLILFNIFLYKEDWVLRLTCLQHYINLWITFDVTSVKDFIPRRNNFSSSYLSFLSSVFSYSPLIPTLCLFLFFSFSLLFRLSIRQETRLMLRVVWHGDKGTNEVYLFTRGGDSSQTEPVRKHCVILFVSVTPVNRPFTSGRVPPWKGHVH